MIDISKNTLNNNAKCVACKRTSCTNKKAKSEHPLQEEDDATFDGPNKRPQKERQPNWDYKEVMELIQAKEHEHEKLKLNHDARDNIETAI